MVILAISSMNLKIYKKIKKEGINNGKKYERYGFQFEVGVQ